MRLTPCRAAIADCDQDIREAVRRMLDACDIYEPPTPLERLLEYRKLTTEARAALEVDHILPRAIRRALGRIRGRVRGILDLQARHIYVDGALHQHRRTFLHHHEVAHDALDWHRELFVVTPEWALNPEQKRRFEAEANHFAALSIFQVDDFARWQRGRRLELAQLAALAARYGTSLTATARQYVIEQDLPTALLFGRPERAADGSASVRLYFGLANAAYLARFRGSLFGAGFAATDPASSVLLPGGPSIAEHDVEVIDLRDEPRRLIAETMFNSYDTLTLVHVRPKQRKVFGWLSTLGRSTKSRAGS